MGCELGWADSEGLPAEGDRDGGKREDVWKGCLPVSEQRAPWWPCSLGTLWSLVLPDLQFVLPTTSLQNTFLFQSSGTFFDSNIPILGNRLHGPALISRWAGFKNRKQNKKKTQETVPLKNIFRGLQRYHLCSAYARKIITGKKNTTRKI